MEKNKMIEFASNKMLNEGFNCSQSILYGMMMIIEGLDDSKKEELLNIASVFGGGLAGLRQSCGFISGAAIGYSLIIDDNDLVRKKVSKVNEIVIEEGGDWQCSKIIENYPDKSLMARKQNCIAILNVLLSYIYDDIKVIYN